MGIHSPSLLTSLTHPPKKVLHYVPYCVLGALIQKAMSNLISFKEFFRALRVAKTSGLIMVINVPPTHPPTHPPTYLPQNDELCQGFFCLSTEEEMC